ncbi:MAG: hypothetical protein Q9222_003589 [Ikaeria aurantiellina]
MALVQVSPLDRQPHHIPQRPEFRQNGRSLEALAADLRNAFEVPIHGSCSQCHHLHTNKALQLPLDPETHTRFLCERCKHPILGIGRTSTQTTLASIETTAPLRQPQQTTADSGREDDYEVADISVQAPPLRVDTSGNSGHLSTITEGISPANQSSAILTPPQLGNASSERLTSHEWLHHDEGPGGLQQGTQEHGTIEPRLAASNDAHPGSSRALGIRSMERRLREKVRRHLHKPRQFKIHYLGLHVDVFPAPSVPVRHWPLVASGLQPNSQEQVADAPHEDTMSAETGMLSDSTIPASALDPPVLGLGSPERTVQEPSSGHPDPLIGRTATVHEKHERIRVKRREATLKRQAELISKCECRSECNCRINDIPSNAASLGPEPSERSIQVPVHHLQSLLSDNSESTGSRSSSGVIRPPILAGVGSHLLAETPNPTSEGLMFPDGEGRPIFNNRLSQASTAYVLSNGSSASISSRRPASLRRSNTTPASMPRHLVDSPLPDPQESLRDGRSADDSDAIAVEPTDSPGDIEYNDVSAHQTRENSL